MVQMNFNAVEYDPSTGSMDVFETGDYTFQIVKSDAKPTKSGNGTMLVFEIACLDEGFSGKRLTIRLNVVNDNPQAVDIAKRELSAISHVCGILNWTDSQQLHGRPFRARIEKVARTDDPAKFNNEVRAYMDVNGNAPVKGAAAGATGGPSSPPQPPTAPQPAAQQFAPPADAPAAPIQTTVAPPSVVAPPPFAQLPVAAAPPFAQPSAAAPPFAQPAATTAAPPFAQPTPAAWPPVQG